MTKETKYNLIFIAVLILVIAPGGVRLFMKMMDPARTHSLAEPELVQHAAAYVDPVELPPSIDRICPEDTAAWVRSLVSPNGVITPGPLVSSMRALVSERRNFEVIQVDPRPEATEVSILAWREDPAGKSSNFSGSLTIGEKQMAAQVTSDRVLDVPDYVTRSLHKLNFALSPKTVHLLVFTFPPNLSKDVPARLVVESKDGNAWTDSILMGQGKQEAK